MKLVEKKSTIKLEEIGKNYEVHPRTQIQTNQEIGAFQEKTFDSKCSQKGEALAKKKRSKER